MKKLEKAINQYIADVDKLYRDGNATEHSYRPALKKLLEEMTTDLEITNEPKHIDCGAPDYIVTKNNIPLGYIEAKDLSVGIFNNQNKEQFDRYKKALSNLIITDYLSFELFIDGKSACSVTIAKINSEKIDADKKEFEAFISLIDRFVRYTGQNIYSSEQLAKIMADKAKLLAVVINKALKEKTGDDTLSGQYVGFKKILIHNLEVSEFADIYAQTLAYGLFAARLNQNQKGKQPFTRYLARDLIPQSNPFLRKFFNHIAGPDLDGRIIWIVDVLADLFNCVAVDEIQKEFAKAAQDPYIHFYETFLAEYDPALRETRGVYYTPDPVVKFIVRAVDDILKAEFKLRDGLADKAEIEDSSWGGGEKKIHKVQILDPAAGTGTFLAEVIDTIHSFYSKNNNKGMWKLYCKEHLIPRINGFEILMASYAMAHFKLDMKLKETGYEFNSKDRLQVYLTNSLEEPENIAEKLPMVEWLTQEAYEANDIKTKTPVMVVLGNPPYSGESANITAYDFLDDYKKEPGGIDKLKERNPKWLNDDYVKFIRYGQNFIEKYGEGVLAYINNHSFLDNPTFRGMRWNLLNSFDEIYILDLHGNSKKKEKAPDGGKDENVFDIQQGVSINLFIKTGAKKAGELAKVYHHDLYGRRQEKYTYLSSNTLSDIDWKILKPEGDQYFLVDKNLSGKSKYEKGFNIQELFSTNSVGIVTSRDDLAIQPTKKRLIETLKDFSALDSEKARAKYNLGKDSRDWKVRYAQKDLIDSGLDEANITKISYRPFDIRWTYYNGHSRGFLCMARAKVMRHFIEGNNIGLMASRQVKSGNFRHIFVCKNIVEACMVSNGPSEIGYTFPLYLYPSPDEFKENAKRRPNLKSSIVNEIAAKTGLVFTEEKDDTENAFAPIDLLDYIYAVLHSPAYRQKYREFLKIDFPRIPYPQDVQSFFALAAIGEKLRKIHLMENINLKKNKANFPVPKEEDNEINKLSYGNTKVFINETQYFDSVLRDEWEFFIGGYQPAQKWLKDRKGRKLSFDDIEHYQKIISAIRDTIDLQTQIDKIFDA